MMTNEINISLF